MTMRAKVERDAALAAGATKDGYGNQQHPSWQTLHAELPCFFYVPVGREIIDQGVKVIEAPRLLIPKGTDITELDRINGISDRLGAPIQAGIMRIGSVIPVHDHIEVALVEVQ